MREAWFDRLASRRTLGWMIAALAMGTVMAAAATEPALDGTGLPAAIRDRLKLHPRAFTFQRALFALTERAAVARTIASNTMLTPSDQSAVVGKLAMALSGSPDVAPATKVQGTRRIPVILVNFNDSGSAPYPAGNLQRELFDGPWATGTMTDYYKEVSNNALTVSGKVYPWARVGKSSDYYSGPDYIDSDGSIAYCYGLCPGGSHLAELLRSALDANKAIDWGQFDNDGPDGIPNSGDDDGFVDFVAFVHAGVGGECKGENNRNIWSHRGSLTGFGDSEYVTTAKRKNGGFIKIDDYVVVPALACDGSTMIQIGVFAHEFGHAFQLPDLYDTTGHSAGLGNWDLMASGSWGGDGVTPARPSHMSAWSKDFLGWIDVEDLSATQFTHLTIQSIEASRKAYRVAISPNMYYLVSVIDRSGFDEKLPASGLQILQVNQTVVKSGLATNRVNADSSNPGVKLIEADGLDNLLSPKFRGGPDDLYPGGKNQRTFDLSTKPASIGHVALCSISDVAPNMTVSYSMANGLCSAGAPLIAAPVALKTGSPAPQPSDAAPAPDSVKEGGVVIQGKLLNLGSNYFDRKSRRIVLMDSAGKQIDVVSGLALETVPGPAPQGSLSTYLDKKVEVKGSIEKDATTGRNRLKAESIKILE